jgi:hypothetical protein
MHALETVLLRAIQFVFCLFFTFTVLVYIGAAVLIPFAVLVAVINVLSHGIGFNGIFATIVAVPLVTWLLMTAYRIPGMSSLIMDTGWTLTKMGADNFKQFDKIAAARKGGSESGAAPSQQN